MYLGSKKALMVVVLLGLSFVLAGCYNRPRYGHGHGGYGYGYSDQSRAFENGYREGYEHGEKDRRAGLDYNYQHDDDFYDEYRREPYLAQAFRNGYIRGYQEAYYGGRYNRRY